MHAQESGAAAGYLTTSRQLAAVAAARSRRFFVLAGGTGTAVWLVGWCALPSLWLLNLAVAAGSTRKIRVLRSASLQLDCRSAPKLNKDIVGLGASASSPCG